MRESISRNLQSGGHGMLAGLEKSRDLCEFLRCKHFPEGWHIHTAIHDANHEVALGQFIADITEIGSSTAAIAVDQVAIEATFVMKEFCAGEHRPTGCANYFLRQRWRIEIWRPRRFYSLNPE